MDAATLAHRLALTALIDALPIHDKVVAHGRLLALMSDRDAMASVTNSRTLAREVARELDAIVATLRRSALASLAE